MPIDYKEYPPNWNTEIRPAVLKRAGNKCEECGAPNGALVARLPKSPASQFIVIENNITADDTAEFYRADGYKITKIVLTIAHLDHDKSNHNVSLDRLRAWCQKCHLGYDRNRHIDNRKYGRNHNHNNYKLF